MQMWQPTHEKLSKRYCNTDEARGKSGETSVYNSLSEAGELGTKDYYWSCLVFDYSTRSVARAKRIS